MSHTVKTFFEIGEMTELEEQVYQIVESGNPQGKYVIIDVEKLDALRSEVTRLREALRPFAGWAETLYPDMPDDYNKDMWATAADLRRAAAALKEER